MRRLRPARLCRSWLLLEGANEAVLARAPESGADVLTNLQTIKMQLDALHTK